MGKDLESPTGAGAVIGESFIMRGQVAAVKALLLLLILLEA